MESLAVYLHAQQNALLEHWRVSCDTQRSETRYLAHEVAQNCVRQLLGRLLEQPVSMNTFRMAADLGRYGYQQGYSLRNVLKEMACLRKAVRQMIYGYGQQYNRPMEASHEQISTFFDEVIEEITEQYTALQTEVQQQQMQEAQQTLSWLNRLEQERSELMRTTTHDLRGSLGMVEGAASLISEADRTPEQRQQILQILHRNLENVHTLVEGITELARLKTLKETPERFDAAALLQHIIERTRPQALARGLTLLTSGLEQLYVLTDAQQAERLIQTLLVYLIRQTPEGSQRAGKMTVSWDIRDESVWVVTIQDTTPVQPLRLAHFQRLSQELQPKESDRSEHTISENLPLFLMKHLSQSIGARLYVNPVGDGSVRYEIHFMGTMPSLAEVMA